MKKSFIFLLFIVCIGLFLRLYRVTDIPPALSWDEVSIGYNAYSILKTGHDEHGRFLPFDAFTAYGDYKPPLPVYITVPFVAVFGLNELSVRLPSVLFGTGVIILIYFVTLELLLQAGKNDGWSKRIPIAVGWVTSLIVAISPWAINLSRAGFEANIGLFLVLLGVYLTLRARRHPRVWTVAWLPLVAAVYTFNSSRYFAPFIGFGLVIYCWRDIMNHRKQVILGVIIAALAMLPILPHLFSKEARLRFVEVNIFSDSGVVTNANKLIEFDNHSLLAGILHNRRVGYARSFFMHYFDNISPEFLFIRGDGNPKFSTQDVGTLYLVDLPFLLIGAYYLFMYRRREALFFIFWLVAAIIPAATARETPHALRILNSLPVWHLVIGFGLVMFIYKAVTSRKKLVTLFVAAAYMVSVLYYLHGYYVHYPRLYSNEWQYGYKQALEYVSEHGAQYKQIYISDIIGRPYMYTLFYTQYDPAKFMMEKKSYFDAAGFYHVDGFDKFIFSGMLPALDSSSLYIFPPDQTPGGVTVRETIPLVNGSPVLTIFDKK